MPGPIRRQLAVASFSMVLLAGVSPSVHASLESVSPQGSSGHERRQAAAGAAA